MERIAIVSCGKAKRTILEPWEDPITGRVLERAQPLELRDLYTGSLFRAARQDVERRGVPWLVVSALHGCRTPDYRATPYDLTIRCPTWDNGTRRRWGERCALAAHQVLGIQGAIVELHTGADYAAWLEPPLRRLGATIDRPVSGPIGQRLRAYRLRREGCEISGQTTMFER